MTLDDLVIKELGRLTLQAMRDALEKAQLKARIAELEAPPGPEKVD